MRYPLVVVALVALIGASSCISPVFAQAGKHETSAPVLAQLDQGYTVGRTRSEAYRDRSSRRRRHVHHRAPDLRKVAEQKGFKRVSDLVNFPKFFPGLGILFVKPDTLPLGPFLAFDRQDRLVATVYMVPIKDMDDHKSFEAPAFAGRTDHVIIYFNAGHPGVDVPHYHFVIWHVSKKDEARVAK